MPHFIELTPKANIVDTQGKKIAQKCLNYLAIDTGIIRCSQIFIIHPSCNKQQLLDFAANCLQNPITQDYWIDNSPSNSYYQSSITIRKLRGVTDDEGRTAQIAWNDYFNTKIGQDTQAIFSQNTYYIQHKLPLPQLELIAKKILGNPLIHSFHFNSQNQTNSQLYNYSNYSIKKQLLPFVQTIDLDINDQELVHLSKQKVWALNLKELNKIKDFFAKKSTQNNRKNKGLNAPTDCELEILAQTWSEHCKHKEFNAIIHYNNRTKKEQKTIHALFDTYIKKATAVIQKNLEKNQNNWLVKVFSDNAGVVKATEEHLFVWKVETHNSPSALDPYGGAITGILGNNRDPLGTGIGGAKLLFNTNILCFGSPNYDKPLLTGQLHPRQILEGVVQGIADGGNKSGVPTVNGAIIFDERYSGKPLVYCGTGALMPYQYQGKDSWTKEIATNDRIIIAGGRVGKDGIHGATFSSVEIDESSPSSAVQIGSPITQKKLADFLLIACQNGWVKTCTDNGAGGLSSSIGELAIISNGAVVHLEKVPLKYEGLQPWEIFVSESQERMTLVVNPSHSKPLFELALKMEVELADIGCFTNEGYLDVRYQDLQVAYLEMDFLHHGVPQKVMYADWQAPQLQEPQLSADLDYNIILLQLLAALNICSRESIIRQYDHEVKGKTIIKPLMGQPQKAPQDAAVMRFDFNTFEGVAISNGILPRYGDIDAYEMSAGAFDEGIRQIISVGGRLPNIGQNDGIFWSVNDNFCVPDSEYHPTTNPDGKEKLAKLVQMCEALYDMATYFDIPLTSGKDSMKNDFKADGVKISIPPTILYSMTAKINDVRKTITSDWKTAGSLIYQVGETYNELGASEFYNLYDELGANVPKVRKEKAKDLYLKMMQANDLELIQSCHDLSDGGLVVALAEACFGNSLGLNIDLNAFGNHLDLNAILFAESHSRFVVSIAPKNKEKFEAIFGARCFYLGKTTASPYIHIQYQQKTIIDLNIQQLLNAWQKTLK